MNLVGAKINLNRISADEARTQWLKCSRSPAYFIREHIYIYNATKRGWIRFAMWPAQEDVLHALNEHQYFILLKARQLGMSWLCLSYALWLMLFRPAAAIMLFSKRDNEAIELLSRVRGMYNRLPRWMQSRHVQISSKHEFKLSNGSTARAMPTTGGRSYTGTFVLLDEADFVPDLAEMLNSLKPTVDAGGQMVLISTVDKKRPLSAFKNIFRAAQTGQNSYCSLFHSWRARPDRTDEWYSRISADMFSQSGSNDDLWQEYPETIEQALAPLALDKRIPFAWLDACIAKSDPIESPLSIPGLLIYATPETDRTYVIGADPAEGNPNSDDSALTVLDAETWQEAASYAGKVEPGIFASIIDQVGQHFNNADVMPERNNHGHTLIRALQESGKLRVLNGYDGKPGWLTNIKGKPLLWDATADAIREATITLRTSATIQQIASIEASTLAAPEGLHDDRAMSLALCVAALAFGFVGASSSAAVQAIDPLAVYDREAF